MGSRSLTSPEECLDLPAGKGENSRALVESGFEVRAADLFPDRLSGQGFPVDAVDLTQPLPYEDERFDGVLNRRRRQAARCRPTRPVHTLRH